MKTIICATLLFQLNSSFSQPQQNIFIITTDGYRWQEVFNGADSSIIHNTKFVKDTGLLKQMYWDVAIEERRKKLMPFFWNVIAREGQLYGNQCYNNKVSVKNIYKISYPGYNELLTGFADPFPVLNTPTYNRNISVLEYLNEQPEYKGQVVAFSSWDIFPFVLNTKRNKMLLNSGYQPMSYIVTDSSKMTEAVQGNVAKKTNVRYDLLTYLTAREYIQSNHPRVVYISLGETDEFAHKGRYDLYLQKANEVDRMIGELWYFVQSDPFYKNNTTFLITTDHGRGNAPSTWSGHNSFIKGSGDIWLALIGKNVEPLGEMMNNQKIFQNQFASTIASFLQVEFVPGKKIGKPLLLTLNKYLVGNMNYNSNFSKSISH